MKPFGLAGFGSSHSPRYSSWVPLLCTWIASGPTRPAVVSMKSSTSVPLHVVAVVAAGLRELEDPAEVADLLVVVDPAAAGAVAVDGAADDRPGARGVGRPTVEGAAVEHRNQVRVAVRVAAATRRGVHGHRRAHRRDVARRVPGPHGDRVVGVRAQPGAGTGGG